jgi:hypothetical protein
MGVRWSAAALTAAVLPQAVRQAAGNGVHLAVHARPRIDVALTDRQAALSLSAKSQHESFRATRPSAGLPLRASSPRQPGRAALRTSALAARSLAAETAGECVRPSGSAGGHSGPAAGRGAVATRSRARRPGLEGREPWRGPAGDEGNNGARVTHPITTQSAVPDGETNACRECYSAALPRRYAEPLLR